MPSSSGKAAETTAYKTVCTAQFTQIHGRPKRQDYKTLKQEASDLASEVNNITFTWSCITATGEEYGLLAEIIRDAKYAHITNLNWTQEIKPATYDPAIQAAGGTYLKAVRRRVGRETRIMVHTASEIQIQLIVTIRLQPLWLLRPLQPCNQFCEL